MLYDTFFVALAVFKMLPFEIVYLEKVGQGHGILPLQWCHFMANMKYIKVVASIFELALIVSEILAFEIFDIEKVGEDHRILLLQ